MAEDIRAESVTWTSRIAFKDDKALVHKPIIRDILRTDICVAGSIMLVEKVENIEASVSNQSAVRVLLGDGQLVIQAFLSPHMHRLVEADEITMGCYVRLDSFNLERVDIERREDGVFLPYESRKRKRPQQVVFLKVHQLDTVGWDLAYMKHARPAVESSIRGDWQSRISRTATGDRQSGESSGSPPTESKHKGYRTPQSSDDSTSRKDIEICNVVPTFGREHQANSSEVCSELVEEAATKKHLIHQSEASSELPETFTVLQEQSIGSQEKPDHQSLPANSALKMEPKKPKEIFVPLPKSIALAPRTLASLSALPSRQNSPCTVFAVIDDIAPVKPCPIPPHKTREVRLVDPSTTKRVLLSVLWQPEQFDPKVGTPVLLRGLKNHRYDGGSLNAYPKSVSGFTQNDDGLDWWIPFPRGWDGCDVDGYLEWWEQRQKEKDEHP